MSDERPMRPRKGDLFLDIQRGEFRVKVLVEKLLITDAKREAFAEIERFAFQQLFPLRNDVPTPTETATPSPT